MLQIEILAGVREYWGHVCMSHFVQHYSHLTKRHLFVFYDATMKLHQYFNTHTHGCALWIILTTLMWPTAVIPASFRNHILQHTDEDTPRTVSAKTKMTNITRLEEDKHHLQSF